MIDDLATLRRHGALYRLLDHRVQQTAPDREAWQDRLMELEGVDAKELVNRHGQLIAFGWIEQNTGHAPPSRPGAVAQCYQLTSAGLRALRRADSAPNDEEEAAQAA
jgi:hypothetical protein